MKKGREKDEKKRMRDEKDKGEHGGSRVEGREEIGRRVKKIEESKKARKTKEKRR